MQTGRSFAAHFEDDASREAYLMWSAAQMLVYNAKVEESNYFWKFRCKFWSPEPLPKPDQKYAHLVNPDTVPWVKEVPSAVRGIGAYRFFQAMTRFMRGLSKRPHRKPIRNADRQLTLTRDCFSVKQVSQKWWELTFGSKKKTAGRIRFRAHRRFEMPAMVMITCTNQCLQLGFSYEDELTEFPETEEEILDRLGKLTPEELAERTIGGDVGVKIRLQLSNGESFNLSEIEKTRIARKDFGRRRHQRRLARMKPGSSNYRKQTRKIAKTYVYEKNVNNNFCHQTSHKIAVMEGIEVVALEDLNVAGMVRRPKPKYDDKGRAQPNGAAAKSGLNKAVTKSHFARLRTSILYKCRRNGKVAVFVNAKNSSRECSKCGYTAKENRPSQAVFCCRREGCGHEENADLNASRVIRKRGVKMILEGLVKKKESKKLLRVPRAKKRNIGGGSPRIDACRVLRVFLRPSRRWNRGGFESGSRRREDLQIKKLRPSGRKVITKTFS